MLVSQQSRTILFYTAAVLPLTAVLLAVTTVYAACNHKVGADLRGADLIGS